jgi:hypothetical protein
MDWGRGLAHEAFVLPGLGRLKKVQRKAATRFHFSNSFNFRS